MLKFYESLSMRQRLAVAVPLPDVSSEEEADLVDLQFAQPSIHSPYPPYPSSPAAMPRAFSLNSENAPTKLRNRMREFRTTQKTESINRETQRVARLNRPSVMLPASAGTLTSYYKPENFLENPREQAEQEESAQLFLESAWSHNPEFLPAKYQFKSWHEQLVCFAKQEAREAAKIAVRRRLPVEEKPDVYFAAFWKRYGEVLDLWPEATKRIARYRLNFSSKLEAESVVKNSYFSNGDHGEGSSKMVGC
jgi:hypothetical protein